MTKILITGGAGFIGSNYVYLVAQRHPEYEITILDSLTYAGNRANLAGLKAGQQFDFQQVDVGDLAAVDQLFLAKGGFDYVVHFAAESHVDRSIVAPGIFVQTNIVGTHNLLFSCRKYGVRRYHQVSTDEVYGDLGEGSTDLFHEDTPLSPHPPYAATKAAADLLVQSYISTYDFPATISRCSNNYGPYQFPEKAIPLFFLTALQGGKITLHGQGQHIRDWLYVKDHCVAIDEILHRAKIGEVYNIGGNFERSVAKIAELILTQLNLSVDEHIISIPDRNTNDLRYAICADKIKQDLGWSPSVTFEEGFTSTLQWYKNNQDWLFDILQRERGSMKNTNLRRIKSGFAENVTAVAYFTDKFTY